MLLVSTAWAQSAEPKAPPVIGQITATSGGVQVVPPVENEMITFSSVRGSEVHPNDVVATQAKGRACVTLADHSIASLGSRTWLRVAHHDAEKQQTSLALDHGRVRFEVTRITRDGGFFEVHTPDVAITVLGTDFLVIANDAGTTVLCFSGKVHVEAKGSSADVAAGQQAMTAGGKLTVSELPKKLATGALRDTAISK